MQGGQGPGRGIYVTRRVVAALVVLLLIILFIPWACQNLLGPGEQSGSETSETDEADRSDDGGEEAARDEEVDTGEEAAKDEDSGAERGDTARELNSEAGSEDDEADSGEEEDGGGGGASNIELDTLGFVPGFEAVGGVDQGPPTLGFGIANQQNVQPAAPAAAPAEPVSLPVPAAPAGPPVAAEPIIPAEPVVPVEPVFFEDPFLFQDPLLFDDVAFFQEPVVSEEPVVLKEAAPQDAGPISIASATNVEVERRGDRGRGGNNRRDIDRGSRDDGRDLGPR